MRLHRLAIALWLTLLATESRAVTFADGAHHVIDTSNSFPLEGVVVDDGPGGSQTTLEVLEGGEIASDFEASAGLLVRGRSAVHVAGGIVGNVFRGIDVHEDAEATITGGIVTHVNLGEPLGATGAPHLSIEGGIIANQVRLTAGSTAIISGGSMDAVVGAARSLEISGGSIRFDVSVSGETSLLVSGGQLGGLRIHRGVHALVTGGWILHRDEKVRVAVLGSATADVDHLELASLVFGPGAARPIHDLTRRAVYARHRRDWNGDGLPDLTLHFRVEDSGLAIYHEEACLEGELEGKPFLACDDVEVRDRR